MSKGLPRSLDALYGRVEDLEQGGALTIAEGTPVNAVAAARNLVISGVAVHGETVEIGGNVYQFAADDAQTVDDGNIPVDITEHTTASTGALTVASQPIVGDKLTIGDVEYEFVGSDPQPGEIDIGGSLSEAQGLIAAAINGTDGVNEPNPYASAGDFETNVSVITALIGGVAGDSIDTTSDFDSELNSFGALTLGSGADCTNANAAAALVADQDTGSVVLTRNTATVTATATVKGVAGNAIEVDTDMANAAWAGETLAGGVNGTVGAKGAMFADASYIYRAIAANTISNANWRRVALGSAY